ncbi:MAG: piwi domain protein [Deltaproteobacteria bacterium]|nr:piwi domain protein [Deltaproteobacteria bacterium]
MPTDYQIHLNFLAVAGDLPLFTVYRRLRADHQEPRPDDGCMSHSLPISPEHLEQRASYWVRFSPTDSFEPFPAHFSFNNDLTRSMLFHSLREAASRNLKNTEFSVPNRRFLDELSFIMACHAEGQELLVVQPYQLRASDQFGYLVDFHFRLGEGIPFSRRVQQLSLSLDRNFRRNLDFYSDRTDRIRRYLSDRARVFSNLSVPGGTAAIPLSREFVKLPAFRLRSRTYIFNGGRESKSQFVGLRDHGPMKLLDRSPRLLFVFREPDRVAARKLAMSLRGIGGKERFTFPGFQALFKTELRIDSNPIVLPDFSEASMTTALERVKKETDLVVPVLVLPGESDDAYLTHKATFVHAGIPSQVCTLPVIQDDNLLKWSIANIALQVFCKAGGQPWRVQPTGETSLIIGISQSHKLRKTGTVTAVEKYFAFSVLTDSSGLFQRIQVLGEADNETSYLEQLRARLAQVLADTSQQFSRVVVHTSFKLRWKEMDAIQATVAQAVGATDPSKCRFAVVKVNHRHRFFGINRAVNSLVPFEATTVRLGPREYLVWFEGIYPDKPTVTKAFPGPTHLQFLRVSNDNAITDHELLQDLVNLSGANWRGFNAKSAPVSVFYCHLVADLVHDFHERGLPMPAVQDLRPWFL